MDDEGDDEQDEEIIRTSGTIATAIGASSPIPLDAYGYAMIALGRVAARGVRKEDRECTAEQLWEKLFTGAPLEALRGLWISGCELEREFMLEDPTTTQPVPPRHPQ
jgi:hypothetical protein